MSNSFTVNTYSPKDLSLNIGGYPIAGWQSITIARSAKGFTVVRGIRGKATRVRNKDTSATIIITLMGSSPTNDVFSQIHGLDLELGTARIALTLKDTSGSSVFSTNEAYITGYPSASFTGQIEDRVWELFAQTTESYNVGGNSRPSSSLFDSALNEVSDFVNNLF